ncbi:MAG TPA: shikimate kinase [Acidimicrobiia bacterium]|nr:shikimate kinase [Acidimicrobiia bacterium]
MSVTHVVLLGPMGAGKTTLGRALADRLEVDLVDSDEAILALTGQSAADLAAGLGVPGLHDLERSLVLAALESHSRKVIAAAASVVDDEATRQQMSRHLCLWVEADGAILAERRESGPHRRQLSNEEADDLNRVRRLSVANFVIGAVDTSTSTVEESAAVATTILSTHLLRSDDSA